MRSLLSYHYLCHMAFPKYPNNKAWNHTPNSQTRIEMKKVENLQSYLQMVDFYSQGVLLNLKKESYFIFYFWKEDVKTNIKNMHNHLGDHVIVLQKFLLTISVIRKRLWPISTTWSPWILVIYRKNIRKN